MCEVCGMTPCHSRCPNFPGSSTLACHHCGRPIVEGEEYATINDLVCCEECIDNLPYCVLIPMLGGEWNRAGEGGALDGCSR